MSTSTGKFKIHLHQGAYVVPGVSLSVCLSVNDRVKTTDEIFIKILPDMYPWTRKHRLNFKFSAPGSGSRTFFLGFANCEMAFFHILTPISQKLIGFILKFSDLYENFISDVKFWK